MLPNTLVIEGMAPDGRAVGLRAQRDFTEKVILAKIPKVEFFCEARARRHPDLHRPRIEYLKEEGAAVAATSHKGDVLQARAEIVFVHLNAPWLGTFFSPEAFLRR